MNCFTLRAFFEAMALLPLDIARVPLFSELDQEFLVAVARTARRVTVKARECVVSEGDPGGALFLVTAGYFKAVALSSGGKETLFSIMGPGEIFGELSVLDGAPRSATVTALEAGILDVVEQGPLLDLIRTSPSLATQLVKGLCARVRNLSRRCEELTSMSIAERLARAILRLAENHGQRNGAFVRIPIRLSQQDLGSLMGATRESVNKQLGSWESAGLVDVDGGYLVVRDIDGLRTLIREAEFKR